ncbi:MAG: polymer-forming cytoskeletal protein [Bacillota bacterium]|nr:polymer-forming cytoskeletal protein [Bacillota bacterium]
MVQNSKKKKIKNILNNSGSSLVWIAVSMVVLLILIGGILSMASIYHKSSVNNNSATQAYFSARSGINAVVAELQANPNGSLAQEIEALSPGNDAVLDLGTVDFGNNDDMGECQLRLWRTGDKTAYLEATATVGEKKDTVVALLGKQTITNSSRPSIPGYVYVGSADPKEERLTFNSVTGLYFDTANAAVHINGSNKVAPKVNGDIYSKRPLHINGFSNVSGRVNVNGDIFSAENLYIKNYVTVDGNMTSEKEIHFTAQGSKAITVNGKVNGAKILLEQGTEITASNLETPELTLEQNASLTGNVSAVNVTLNQNSTVTGTVDCVSLIINQGASIVGDVKCDSLTIAGNVSSDKVPVQGNVSFRSVTINGTAYTSAEAFNAAFANDNNIANNYFSGSITFFPQQYSVNIPDIENVVPNATVPGAGSAKDLAPAMTSRFSETLGTEDGNDSYYLLDDDDKEVDLTIQGTGNIFVYLTNGADLTIKSIKYKDSYNKEAPTLFIVAEGNSELELGKRVTDFYGYIYAKQGTDKDDGNEELPEIKIDDDRGSTITIHGGVFFDGLEDDDDFFSSSLIIKSIESSVLGDGSGGSDETGREQWYPRQYLDSIPRELEG